MQTYSSAKTSRKQVSAIFKSKAFADLVGHDNADIGGGKYDDGTDFVWDRYACDNHVIDPMNRGADYNRASRAGAIGAETATVANVLNVIDSEDARRAVIWDACTIVDQISGRVLVTVYEGDGSGEGRATRDGWQENRKLSSYISELESISCVGRVERRGAVLVITPRRCM